MNTKMILEVAGAKPLAGQTKPAVLNLPAEKGGRAVCEKIGTKTVLKTHNIGFSEMAQPTNAGEAVPGTAVGGLGKAESLGVGMWKGVFG